MAISSPSQSCIAGRGNNCISGCQRIVKQLILAAFFLPVAKAAYEKIFMGHSTVKPDYHFVCHQRTVFNTLGGLIHSRKEYYEADLQDCSILLTSPQGSLIDFRFTEISIIASDLNTCQDASLRIYDGSTNATSLLLGFPNGICGQAVPSFAIRSTGNNMLLQLRVTSPYTSSFSAIYTAYSSRTSVLCFYCGDLCLQKEQLCDGLDNCWDGEDEELDECHVQTPPSTPSGDADDIKLILILVLGAMAIIFLVIILAILSRKRLMRTCVEKQRQRRAAAATQMTLHPPLTPHVLVHRTESAPVGLGMNRPFMAGPTIPNQTRSTGRAMRSDMPPPYTSLPIDAVNEASASGSRTNILGVSTESGYSENPGLIPEDDPRPHISDNEDERQDASITVNTIVNYNSHTNDRACDPYDIETTFIEEPESVPSVENSLDIGTDTSDFQEHTAVQNCVTDTPNSTHHDSSVHETVTDVTVARPENEIDNSVVDVSTRDTIRVIENLDIGLTSENEEQNTNEEIIYI